MKSSSKHPSKLSLIAARIRSDVRLGIVTLYCVCFALLILPFAIFRLSVGELLIGLVDLSIVGMFVGLMVLAWRSKRVQLAADLTAIAAAAATSAVVLFLGISFLWAFSTLVGNFLMARLRLAVTVNLLMMLSIGLQPAVFVESTERATFLAVSVLVSLFSLIFAARLNHRHGQLNEMVSTDPLTGAFNRRALDLDLQNLCDTERPAEHCLLIMDLDNFKCLNDTSGHDAGDQVLISLARIVRAQTRQTDRFYRYGGEEFVLLLADTGKAGAESVTRKLHEALRLQLHGPKGIVTVSMGLAERRAGESASDWFKRADQALFSAKRACKDRVVEAD